MKDPLHTIKETKKIGGLLKSKSEHLAHLLHKKLWLQVIFALLLGSLVGIILGPDMGLVSKSMAKTITNWLALPGNIFLEMIKMIIIPLIFSSIIIGILSSGDINFLKKIGPRIVVFFVITTIIAINFLLTLFCNDIKNCLCDK